MVREVLADLDTPLSTYLKLANAPYSYLFESVHGGEKWGRYSIIGLPCRERLKVFNREVVIEKDDAVVERITVDDPLTFISEFQQRYQVEEYAGLPRFTGGLVGYFGYETIRYIESRLDTDDKPDPLKTPDILLMVSEEVVVFDNLACKIIEHHNLFRDHQQYIRCSNFVRVRAVLELGLDITNSIVGKIPYEPASESR